MIFFHWGTQTRQVNYGWSMLPMAVQNLSRWRNFAKVTDTFCLGWGMIHPEVTWTEARIQTRAARLAAKLGMPGSVA